jgi:hypothetical protein
MRHAGTATVLVLTLLASPAFAHDVTRGSSFTTLAQQPGLPPCTCRAAGRVFEMGETTCLETPSGPRLAVCAMDQNVSSWRATSNTCPSANRSLRALRG